MYEIEFTDSDGDDRYIPARRTLCPRCNGDGKVSHPAFGNGITESDWHDWDCDERYAYFIGDYDVSCPKCRGKKWALEADEDKASSEDLREYRRYVRVMDELDAMEAAERRYGA